MPRRARSCVTLFELNAAQKCTIGAADGDPPRVYFKGAPYPNRDKPRPHGVVILRGLHPEVMPMKPPCLPKRMLCPLELIRSRTYTEY